MDQRFLKLAEAVERAEQADGGIKKSSNSLSRLRSAYSALLHEFPALHGYRIRLARIEFRMGHPDKALQVYRDGFSGPLIWCSPYWASYLEFLSIVETRDPSRINKEFQHGIDVIGDQFLSHDFWNTYLGWLETQGDGRAIVQTLVHILGLTLHQCAHFYGKLIRLAREAPLDWFGGEIPASGRAPLLASLANQFQNQQDRVALAWAREKRIKRHVCMPSVPPAAFASDISSWRSVIASVGNANISTVESLYQRALVAIANDESMWLSYVRFLISSEPADISVQQKLSRIGNVLDHVPSILVGVKLWQALFLELAGQSCDWVYEKLPTNRGSVVVQWSQYLKRQGKDPQPLLQQSIEQGTDDDIAVLTELAKYDADAFATYPRPESSEYWSAYLRTRPDLAEDIYQDAPEGSVDTEYLDLLARTDVARYVEMDRMINRSALA